MNKQTITNQDQNWREGVIAYQLAKEFILELTDSKGEAYFQDNWLDGFYQTGWDTESVHSDYDVAIALQKVLNKWIVNNESIKRG